MEGEWRLIETTDDDRVVPGPKGKLEVATGDFICVRFSTKEARREMYPEAAHLDESTGHFIVDSMRTPNYWNPTGIRQVFAPAHTAKRRKLPEPPRPPLTEFLDIPYVEGCRDWANRVVHRVAEVEEWPSPNREWNGEDALLTSVCGYHGWALSKHFQPGGAHPRWPKCFPTPSLEVK